MQSTRVQGTAVAPPQLVVLRLTSPTARGESTPLQTTDIESSLIVRMTVRSRCSVRSTQLVSLSEEVDAINDKLTFLKFNEVVAHLRLRLTPHAHFLTSLHYLRFYRSTLQTEVHQLRADAEFLQVCAPHYICVLLCYQKKKLSYFLEMY